MTRIEPPSVELQIAFAARLDEITAQRLAPALSEAVTKVSITALDAELARHVGSTRLSSLASWGLRGELVFPVPLLLRTNPRLLGYYRLLLGRSQKDFYLGSMNRFKSLEEKGVFSPTVAGQLGNLCDALCEACWILVSSLSSVDQRSIRDLQLLTIGGQLRGERLNAIGASAVRRVFDRIRGAIHDSAVQFETTNEIVLRNASGRTVRIAFSADPDIAVTEELATSVTPVLAIEVKGGTDDSNKHNRIGEAEKSHQKARAKGFREFWTIVNTSFDPSVAAIESPTTNMLFNLSRIEDPGEPEWASFRSELTARLGVPDAP